MPTIRIYQEQYGMHFERESEDIPEELMRKIETYICRMRGVSKGDYYYKVPYPQLDAMIREIKKMVGVEFVEKKPWRVE